MALVASAAMVLAMAVVGGVGAGTAVAAGTLPQGITNVQWQLNGSTYNGTDVIAEGDTVKLLVQHDKSFDPGQQVTFTFPGGVLTAAGTPVNIADDPLLASATKSGNDVVVTFISDKSSVSNTEGAFTISLSVDSVTKSESTDLKWEAGEASGTTSVIVKKSGDTFANVTDGYGKTRASSPSNLNSYVSVSGGTVTVAPGIASQDVKYTITLNSAEGRTVAIADTLDPWMVYNTGSFEATITTWDANDLNQQTEAYPIGGSFTPTIDGSGSSFTYSAVVPGSAARNTSGPSKLSITYTAHVNTAHVSDLQTELQDKYDGLNGEPGSYSHTFTNTVKFDDANPKTESIAAGGSISGVSPGSAFSKTAEWASKNVTVEADGTTLNPPADITYTMTANLSQWDSHNTNATLGQNVVAIDTLPEGLSWQSGAGFITATGIAGDPTLTAASCDTSLSGQSAANAFATATSAGSYCVNGQDLLVNIGTDKTTNATITAAAQVTSITGMASGTTTVEGANAYKFTNSANFYYQNNKSQQKPATSQVVVLPADTGDGQNDSSVFVKAGPTGEVTVNPGEAADIPYTFTVKSGNGINAQTSQIRDHIDPAFFDTSTTAFVKSISGSYGSISLDAGDYTYTMDSGDLVIALSTAGQAKVASAGDKTWTTNLTLTTVVLGSDATLEIPNKAVLVGNSGTIRYWSEYTSQATSFSGGAETDKHVYDADTASWVRDLTILTDPAGAPFTDTYVYRIDYVVHGTFGQLGLASITGVTDQLPAGVTFLGFVAPTDLTATSPNTADDTTIGGNMVAHYDSAAGPAGTVTMNLQSGKKLVADAGQRISAYASVKITDATAPIVNFPGATYEVDINPVSASVSWTKTDTGTTLLSGSEWNLTGPDSLDLTVVDSGGNDADSTAGALKVVGLNFGDYTLTETKAPAGYTLDSSPHTFTIDAQHLTVDLGAVTNSATTPPGGNGGEQPDTKTYAVGDYTWIDSNRNGIQDVDEPVLPGVGVQLLNASGVVVATTTTDAAGRYLFDELTAGTYQIKFVLTGAQAAKYSFTKADAGTNATADSDASRTTGLTAKFTLDDSNSALTKTYTAQPVKASQGIDPTWDAGVVAASVSVGDYVWYDANGNGRQDAGEPGIEGVTMCLLEPDGKPVTDVNGNPVKPVATDRNGKYTFEDLPVLTGSQTYTVCIDRAASKHALENYEPTKEHVGDRASDSSTWTASTIKGELTEGGQRDATLDFGFVRITPAGQNQQVKTYAVGDHVWIDTTYNAVQDKGEPGLAGVTVELIDSHGTVLATTTTDKAGFYLFDGLTAGTYQIKFVLTKAQAAKYGFVLANRQGASDAVDSDANTATGLTAKFRLDDGNTALTTSYFRPIAASQGIDPTWDAGVATIEVLGTQELLPLPGTNTGNGNTDGNIAYTGVPAWSMTALALLLLAAGGALTLTARRRNTAHRNA